ncbi:hypothetical protein MCHI_001604 [Candidatus Magnetoovum chiemensis]|nr:hypothetical protein MCHI_001604 [Candidatus Magnetoovum chiemensis]
MIIIVSLIEVSSKISEETAIMITTSILPGRVRFEIEALKGQEDSCAYIKNKLTNTNGISDVSVNPRTGRLLVIFDETVINRYILKSHIDRIIQLRLRHIEGETQKTKNTISNPSNDNDSIADSLLGLAAYLLLPKPFDKLFPIAIRFVKLRSV